MPTKAKNSADTKHPTKWQKFFTPQITISILLCVFCAIMAVVCFINPGTKEISHTSPVENMKSLEVITPKDQIVQKFTSDNDYVSFGLYYANFSNYIQGGKLHVDIGNSNKSIEKFTYDISGAIDNTFLYIDYPLQKDETYTLTIYLTDAQGITFFTTTADNYHATMSRNQQTQPVSIIMSFVTTSKDSFAAWYYIMAIALILCYVVLKIDKDVYAQKS